jgi:predicted ATPase
MGQLANPDEQDHLGRSSRQKLHLQAFAFGLAKAMRARSWRLAVDSTVSIELESAEPSNLRYLFQVGPTPNKILQKITINDREVLKSSTPDSRPPQPFEFRGRKIVLDGKQSLIHQIIEASSDGPIDDLRNMQKELKISTPYHFSPSEMRVPAKAIPSPVLSSRGENLAAVLNSMLTGPDRHAVNELENSIHQAIPTLRGISTPAKDTAGAERVIKFALSGSERPPLTIESDEVSDGAMFLTAFLAVVHTQSKHVLLIEEPENGLHPSRLQSVVELLKKVTTGELGYAPRQVILSTHSPLLLNFVDPSEVRVFRRGTDDATTIVRMDQMPDIDRLTKEFAPGELWYLFGEEGLSREVAR